VKLQIAAAVLVDPGGRTLMFRHEGGLFSGMWQFPSVEVGHRSAQALAQHLEQRLGMRKARLLPLPRARHAVTFREITLLPFLVHAASLPDSGLPALQSGSARMPLLKELDSLPVSSATRKIAQAALAQLAKDLKPRTCGEPACRLPAQAGTGRRSRTMTTDVHR